MIAGSVADSMIDHIVLSDGHMMLSGTNIMFFTDVAA